MIRRGWFPALLYENYVLEAANAAKAAASPFERLSMA